MVEQKHFSEERKKVFIGVCQIRWSERDVSYEPFYLALLFIVETFEVINGTYTELDEFEEIYVNFNFTFGMPKVKLKLLSS